MSQYLLLQSENLIVESILETATAADHLFMEFREAATYQVNVSTIEQLTGLTLPDALETYTDSRKTELILEEVDIREPL